MTEELHRDTEGVYLSQAELLTAMRYDCVTFLGFYLGEELTLEVPDFHEEIWGELLEMLNQANIPGATYKLQKLFAVPREHSKSTLSKLAVILFLRYSPLSFVLYVSKTSGNATNAIRDILAWLQSPQEVALFGAPTVLKSSETESLWIINIMIRRTPQETPWVKTVIFRALGADSHVRGLLIRSRRPQIIVIDDIEDLDNTTVTLQPKLDEWVMGTLLKSFDSMRHVVIFIGNMIRKTTLLARLSKERDWNPTVFGSLVRDGHTGQLRPLWIGKHTVESLLKEYAYYRRMGVGHMWEAEMMNLTHDEVLEQGLGKALRPPTPMVEDITAGCIILDPAFGLKNYNDEAAITVHARIKGLSVPAVIDSWKGRLKEDGLFSMMLEMSYKWGLSTWVIESVAAQRLFIPLFTLMMRDQQLNPDVITFLPVTGGREAKPSRIRAFINSVDSQSYAVCDSQEELVVALENYDPTATGAAIDDLPDSAAYGLIAWSSYGTVIESNGVKSVAMLAMTGRESLPPRTETQICTI